MKYDDDYVHDDDDDDDDGDGDDDDDNDDADFIEHHKMPTPNKTCSMRWPRKNKNRKDSANKQTKKIAQPNLQRKTSDS